MTVVVLLILAIVEGGVCALVFLAAQNHRARAGCQCYAPPSRAR